MLSKCLPLCFGIPSPRRLSVLMPWHSLAVFSSTCLLAPDNPSTSAASWCDRESRLVVICPDRDKEAHGYELHTHPHAPKICVQHWHFISAGMSWVCRHWKQTPLSVTEVVLKCLWIPVKTHHCCSSWPFQLKQHTHAYTHTKPTMEANTAELNLLPCSWQAHRLVCCVHFYKEPISSY